MAEGSRGRLLAILVIALAALVVASNAYWYVEYVRLRSSYIEEQQALANTTRVLANTTARLAYEAKLLNASVKIINAYKNLTALMNVTLMALEAGKLAAVTNVSLQVSSSAIRLTGLATSLIAEANETTDPLARKYMISGAVNATTVALDDLKTLAFLGHYMNANSTYFQYLEAAQASLNDMSKLASQLNNLSATVPASRLASDFTQVVSNVLSAEKLLLYLVRSQSTS
ncbi:MAG: hypothetical protein JHC13_04185 [Acidilobus sp.]|jgi:hypothetical protein|nr:hypothetical protein [Acidilobus sp.]